jgi:hypothetical protein
VQQYAGSKQQPQSSTHHQQQPQGIPADPKPVQAAARRQLLQQPNSSAASTNNSTAGSTTASNSSNREAIKLCPAWADDAATAGGALQLGSDGSGPTIQFSADFNQAEHGGVTAADRQAAITAAAAAAAQAARGTLLPPGNSSSNATEPPPVAFVPGLFDPLTVDEMLAGGGGSWSSSSLPGGWLVAVVCAAYSFRVAMLLRPGKDAQLHVGVSSCAYYNRVA